MLFSDEWALMPRRISVASWSGCSSMVASWLPSSTPLIDSLTSRGHDDCTASQNDTGSGIDGCITNSLLTWSSVRWWKERHAILMRSVVTVSLHDRVSLCTRGQASRSPSWQRLGTDWSTTSSSVTWLPLKHCTMETRSIRNQVINVFLNRVFLLTYLFCLWRS